MLTDIIYIVFGYIVGSIPFGYIYVKYTKGIDLRKMGSHCTGATNVMRNSTKLLAALTLLSDLIKGVVVALISCNRQGLIAVLMCFACILGHVYPIWLKLHGGKGVAVAAGIFLCISTYCALISAIVWGIVAKITKKSSIASLVFVSVFAIFETVFDKNISHIIFAYITLVLIIFTHRSNIKRIANHQELNVQ